MKRFHNILVGVELINAGSKGSVQPTQHSRHAIDRAIWLAQHTGGMITIFSSLHASAHLQAAFQHLWTAADQNPQTDVQKGLAEIVVLAEAEGVRAKLKVGVGVPWKQICRQVQTDHYDLVIVGTRDVERQRRLFYGPTVSRLLHYCPCPVWVAGPDLEEGKTNILVPSDFSDVSLDALLLAVNGGQFIDAAIHVVHAIEFEGQSQVPFWIGPSEHQLFENYVNQLRAAAMQKLKDQVAQTDFQAVKHGVHIHVLDETPGEAILKAIDDYHIDLVVMGTAARSGIPGLMIGNTAERLFPHLKCSLIAVKPSEFVCPISTEG